MWQTNNKQFKKLRWGGRKKNSSGRGGFFFFLLMFLNDTSNQAGNDRWAFGKFQSLFPQFHVCFFFSFFSITLIALYEKRQNSSSQNSYIPSQENCRWNDPWGWLSGQRCDKFHQEKTNTSSNPTQRWTSCEIKWNTTSLYQTIFTLAPESQEEWSNTSLNRMVKHNWKPIGWIITTKED